MTQDFYRGDIFFIAHSPVSGSEQGGHRPGVIVSNDLANRYSPNVEVVFLTSQEKKPMLVPKCKSGRIICHENCGGADND